MRNAWWWAGFFAAVLLLGSAWFLVRDAGRAAPVAAYDPPSSELPITPVPAHLELDPRKVQLGRRLFHDKRLSHDGSIACASCHDFALAGADGRPHAVGIGGRISPVNSPTVLNSGFNFRQFWDGRAETLEAQIEGPLHNSAEMASNWQEALAVLRGDADYRRDFAAIWSNGITIANIQAAIAEFERALITPDAPFDRYLRGDTHALSEVARQGWELFQDLGCIACHQGVNVGGNMYANLGIMGDYFADRGKPLQQIDLGRFNVTGREVDRHLFKVPGLRNVARTAPYFHDGSIATLEEAVDTMARYQLGVRLETRQRKALLAFLESLNGSLPEAVR